MRRFGSLAAALLLVALAVSRHARADEADVAEVLFREGHALLKEQRYAEACPKFAESELHDKASGTLLALAYCQELAHALASARASYVAAAELARGEHQPERERAATERAEVLTKRLSTLKVDVPELVASLPGLRVTRNGVELAQSEWGQPLPGDGGTYDIVVSASNRKSFSTQVLLGPEQEARVVTVPMLPAEGATVARRAGPQRAAAAEPVSPVPERHYWTTPRVIGWAAVGVGAVTGVASLFFTVSAKSAQDDVQNMLHAEESAPAGSRVPWDAAGHQRELDGKHAAALAQGFGVTSGALLVGGAALVIFGAEKRDAEASHVSVSMVSGIAQFNYARAF